MKPSLPVALIIVLSVCVILPCSASYAIRDVTLTPLSDAYLPGSSLNASALLPILPSGPTTYIEGYTLVLSTDLDRAGWNVSILVDGRQAAVFEKIGTAVFINGYLLSYPVNRDVAVKVTLDGAVPSHGAGSSFNVLRVTELNNQGLVIPGSEQVVARPIAVPVTSSFPPAQSGTVAEHPATPTAAGISPVPVLGSILLIFFFATRRER
jgi:hypothetical protein